MNIHLSKDYHLIYNFKHFLILFIIIVITMESFALKVSPFVHAYEEKVDYKGMMLNLVIIRSRSGIYKLPNCMVVSSTDITYPIDMVMDLDFFKTSYYKTSSEWHLCSYYSLESFDLYKELKTQHMPIDYNTYHVFLRSYKMDKKVICRFALFPNDYFHMLQIKNMNFKFAMTSKNTNEMALRNYKISQYSRDIMLLFDQKKANIDTNKKSIADLTDQVNRLYENMTLDNIKLYLKMRHNTFASICCTLMGIKEEALDQKLSKIESYNGDYKNLTPDVITKDGNKEYTVIEFAVTEAQSAFILQQKLSKYEPAIEDIQSNLQVQVTLIVMIYNCRDPEESLFYNYHQPAEDILKASTPIFDTHKNISSLEEYKKMKMLVKEDLSESNMLLIDEKMMLINEELLKAFNKPFLSASLKNQRNDKRVSTTNQADTELIELRARAVKSDSVLYEKELFSVLNKLWDTRTFSEEVQSMFQITREEIFLLGESIIQKQELLRENSRIKIPKFFKFPILDMTSETKYAYPELTYESSLNDGTVIVKDNIKMVDDEQVVSREGIYCHEVEDFQVLQSYLEFFREESSEKFREKMMQQNFPFWLKKLMGSKVMEILYMTTELFRNIAYLEGRRRIKEDKKLKTGKTIWKKFDNYILILKGGSALTKEKSLRYMVLVDKGTEIGMTESYKWTENPDNSYSSTRWLSVTLTDMGHFMMLFEKGVALLSHYRDMELEQSVDEPVMLDDRFMIPLMILMEHRRGTSTTCQLNRYLLHSATGIVSDKIGMLKTVMKDPIRSRLEAIMRLYQMKFFLKNMESFETTQLQFLKNVRGLEKNFDKVFVWNFFEPNRRSELSSAMNDMYLGNLLNKDHGFTSHRVKAIVSKMADEEKNFLKIREEPESRGVVNNLEDFLIRKNKHHTFDLQFVKAAGKRLWEKLEKSKALGQKLNDFCTSVLDDAMMLTSSVYEVPVESKTVEESGDWVEKDYSFMTLYKKVQEMSTNNLLEAASYSDIIEAMFDLFPKGQIGGPREILIMTVALRMQVKAVEKLARELCSLHEKEMLTKDHLKTQIQSDTMQAFKEEILEDLSNGKNSFMFSLNSDATRWSPAMVMDELIVFVDSMGLNNNLKEFLISVIKAFSCKRMFLPKALRDKWTKKPESEKELDETLQWFREKSAEEDWAPFVYSGMGQGMLHFLSSLYHCAMDDYCDYMIKKKFGDSIKMVTLISSDDKTKIVKMELNRKAKMSSFLKYFISTFDSCQRLANIHMNWKKTSMHFSICEFNSLFSVGKRMVLAVIKDVYSAMEIPDLTYPEEAVKTVYSSLSRMMTNGAYFTTINLCAELMREALKNFYGYNKLIVSKLMETFECKENQLPIHLGFLRTDKLMAALLYGPDFYMYDPENSKTLMRFYKNLYTGIEDLDMSNKDKSLNRDPVSGKIMLELPTRLDKRLQNLKNSFYKGKNMDDIKDDLEKYSLMVNYSNSDMEHYKVMSEGFLMGVNRKYEFQATMKIHSLVRALALRGEKVMINISNESFSLDEAVNLIMQRDEKKSFFFLTQGMERVWQVSEDNYRKLGLMRRERINRHPKKRDLHFYVSKLWDDYSEREIINALFSLTDKVSTRVRLCLDQILKCFPEEIMQEKNPFELIKKMFPWSSRPMSSFKTFLSYHRRVKKNMTLSMLSDTPDTGSMVTNMLNILRFRSSPEYVLEGSDNLNMTEISEDLNTWISMGMNAWDFPKLGEVSNLMRSRDDTPMELLMKCMLRSRNETKEMPDYHLFYSEMRKRDRILRFYYWESNFLMCEYMKEKDFMMYKLYNGGNEFDNNSPIWSLLRQDMVRHFKRDTDFKMISDLDCDSVLDVGYTKLSFKKTDLTEKVKFHYQTSYWTAMLQVFQEESFLGSFKIIRDNYNFYKDSLQRMDDSLIKKISKLYNSTLSLREIYNIVKELGWLSDQKFDRKENKSENPFKPEDYSNLQSDVSILTDMKFFDILKKYQMEDEDDDDNFLAPNLDDTEDSDEKRVAFTDDILLSPDLLKQLNEISLQTERDDWDAEEVELPNFERLSVVNLLSMSVTRSLRYTIQLEHTKIRNITKMIQVPDKGRILARIILANLILYFKEDGEIPEDSFLHLVMNRIINMTVMTYKTTVVSNVQFPDKNDLNRVKSQISFSIIAPKITASAMSQWMD